MLDTSESLDLESEDSKLTQVPPAPDLDPSPATEMAPEM